MKPTGLLACAACSMVALVMTLGYIMDGRARTPKLLFSLPIQDCMDLDFGVDHALAWGSRVDAICRGRGHDGGNYFAMPGRIAVRFGERGSFVYGGRPNTNEVYFFSYDSKFKWIVQSP